MPVTDPIADMITRIRNAGTAGHRRLDVPASRVKYSLAELLKGEAYIEDFRTVKGEVQDSLRIYLKYNDDAEPVIKGIERVSKPGRRVYVKRDEIPRVLGGLGTAVISTSQGILTDKQARERGLGGEVMVRVW